jgi:hypothetical protein
MVGGRRTGKSYMQAHLLNLYKKRFDLIISFSGSESCSPELTQLIQERFDERLIFSEWKQDVVDTLIKQQHALKKQGRTRHVLILVDDIILNSQADFSLANLAMRGRHFNVSLMMLSVSYTTIDKRIRRSLDCLFLFSVPMSGDLKVLTSEYTRSPSVAQFCLSQMKEHTALIMETFGTSQKLYQYRAPCRIEGQNSTPSSDTQCQTLAAPATSFQNQMEPRLEKTDGPQCNKQGLEN